jgi:hypothetical protein
VTYSLTDDKCNECAFGYYPSPDGKKCLEYPTGIEGCRTYISKYSCQSCEANKYLQGDFCVLIPEDERIDNCVYYVDKFNCE